MPRGQSQPFVKAPAHLDVIAVNSFSRSPSAADRNRPMALPVGTRMVAGKLSPPVIADNVLLKPLVICLD